MDIEYKVDKIKQKISIFNNINIVLNDQHNIANVPLEIIAQPKPKENTYIEKKEKDLIKALKLLKAKYDVKNNKLGNFGLIEDTDIIKLEEIDIENAEKIYTWIKLPEEDKKDLIDIVVEKEKEKNKLDDNTCDDLRILLFENNKNIIYDKHNKRILGYKNLLYIVGNNNKKIYVFNNISKLNVLTNKISKKIYKF